MSLEKQKLRSARGHREVHQTHWMGKGVHTGEELTFFSYLQTI